MADMVELELELETSRDGRAENVKSFSLRRAISGGFGFSLMGGKGTNFPPVICDVLTNSPASKCEQMQVGDIILAINGEPVHGKTTKEVVTSLMRSPDDLMLTVQEDTKTKNQVLKFLEPLYNPPGSTPKIRFKSIGRGSPKHKSAGFTESSASEPVRTGSLGGESSPIIAPSPIHRDDAATVNSDSPPSLLLPQAGHDTTAGEERVLPEGSRQNNNKSGISVTDEPPGGVKAEASLVSDRGQSSLDTRITCPVNGIARDRLRDRDGAPSARWVHSANAYSYSSDSSMSDIPPIQVMTTVAQIHREDSSLVPPRGRSDEVDPESDGVGQNAAKLPAVALAESESLPSDLSSQASSCPSEGGPLAAELPLCTQKLAESRRDGTPDGEKATPVNRTVRANESDSVMYDSGYASMSSVTKQSSQSTCQSPAAAVADDTPSRLLRNDGGGCDGGAPLQNGNNQPDAWNGGMGSRTSSDRSVNSEESECLDMDSLGNALQAGSKNLDVPSAQRLAKRLYMLDGFKRSDVSKHLSKRNDFSKLVADEYLTYFDFTSLPLDIALRKFLAKIAVAGETQERERVLLHFSMRYQSCNEIEYRSVDAVHTLTCALMLLNSDLHGQNIGKKMSFSAFVSNLEGLNEGEDFSKETLKTFYQSIKMKPLDWACDEDEKLATRTADNSKTNGTMRLSGNPFMEVQNDPNAPVYIKGYIMRKITKDSEGRKTSRGKRSWKMYFATVKGLILYLHKSEMHHQMHFNSPKEAVSLHHSLASKASDYTKRPNVFNLHLSNWKEFFIQCLPPDEATATPVSNTTTTTTTTTTMQTPSDAQEMQNWMQAFNLAAAMHSSPPLPAAVGLQKTFRRPLLPCSPSKLNMQEQLSAHEQKVESLEQDLEDHRAYPPEQGQRTMVMKDYQTKQEYLEYELSRFKAYIYLLHSQPTIPLGKYTLQEVMPQTGSQSVDGISSPSSSAAAASSCVQSDGSQGATQQNKGHPAHPALAYIGRHGYDDDSDDDTDDEDEDDDDDSDFEMEEHHFPLNSDEESTHL